MTAGHSSHAALQHGCSLQIRPASPLIVQCSNEDTPVAKTAVEFDTPKLSEPTINLVPELPELKLPKFDLDALFACRRPIWPP